MFNGKIHYKLDMFNSYVSLPQGIWKGWGNAPNSLTGLRWASFSAALDLAFLFFSSLTASMHWSQKNEAFWATQVSQPYLTHIFAGKTI